MAIRFRDNPALVVLSFWVVSFLASIWVLSGTPQYLYVVPLQAACMIGSVGYLARFMKVRQGGN